MAFQVKTISLATGMMRKKQANVASTQQGFTLLEVMVALVVVAVGLGALLVATSQNIRSYELLKEHMIQQWVELQTENMLHLQLLQSRNMLPFSNSTTILGLKCYWQVGFQSTSIQDLYYVKISTKINSQGPWTHHANTYLFIEKSG